MRIRNNQKKVLIIFTIIILVIRFSLLFFPSFDYRNFLSKWINYIQNNGGLLSLNKQFSNYNLPYLTILVILSYIPIKSLYTIKIVSIIFDFLMALIGYKLVYELCYDKKNRINYAMGTYAILLALPTVVLNGSFLCQCDSIYTFFVLLSLYYLIKEKYRNSFISLGVAFSFKLQFIFILPLFIILCFCKKKVSILNLIYIPITNFILCIPGMLVGASLFYTYKIYFLQSVEYNRSYFVTNIYNYLPVSSLVNKIGIVFTLFLFFVLLVWCYKSKFRWSRERIITLGLLSIMLCYFFLPCMHERYFYMADVLSVIWYMSYRKNIYIPIIVNLCSFMSYISYICVLNKILVWMIYNILPILLFFAIVKLFLIFYNLEKVK